VGEMWEVWGGEGGLERERCSWAIEVYVAWR
jgi:hypothetical protein